MVITEQLLNKKYRFREEYFPLELTQSQRDARTLFLNEVHKKKRYISLTACPYCGHDKFNKISEVERRGLPSDIAICDSCDGCFKLTLLDSDANKFHYGKISYLLRGKEFCDDAMEATFEKRIKAFAYPRYHFLSYFLKLNPDQDLITEFGCNDGANLFPWEENGFRTIGVDLDPRVVSFGNRKGLNLICEDFLNYSFSDKRPKLVILSHVLEHVSDVNATLNRLYEILKPDGYLFIESPGLRVHGLRNVLAYFDVEHNYNFDLGSLEQLLVKHYFQIIYGDEQVRIICTPSQNKFIPTYKNLTFSSSFNRIRLGLLKKCINPLNSKKKKLLELLREGESNNLNILILNRLQMLYFKYHNLAIVNSQENGIYT